MEFSYKWINSLEGECVCKIDFFNVNDDSSVTIKVEELLEAYNDIKKRIDNDDEEIDIYKVLDIFEQFVEVEKD